jgi:hypothetical protein
MYNGAPPGPGDNPGAARVGGGQYMPKARASFRRAVASECRFNALARHTKCVVTHENR